ncbi:nucleoside-diphosphate sugar epimerase [Paenibacillus turpanensis]|uniref:nucleoside-diphosphate sugar epimerase n=1 Tax=Paenibacillus turpanensis TaxID=2689078 RepID=UPI0014092F05|nr:nucleoside-diphosphate sugar epimerase [Paenibacillus turpanensis]
MHQSNAILHHMAKSHSELARILEAKRDTIIHAAAVVGGLPDRNTSFCTTEDIAEHSLSLTKNLAAYLYSLSELEEALAENLTCLVKEMQPGDEE